MTTNASTKALRNMKKPDPFYGYGGLSILLHWATALMVLALAISAGELHISLGLVFALVLVWRAIRRWGRGFPRVADQWLVLNVIERLAKITILLALIVLAITGLTLPFVEATPYPFFVFGNWQAPFEYNETAAYFLRQAHSYAAWCLYGSIGIHLAAAIKHIITNKDGIIVRIVKPVAGGK